jgi:hypothetical protein
MKKREHEVRACLSAEVRKQQLRFRRSLGVFGVRGDYICLANTRCSEDCISRFPNDANVGYEESLLDSAELRDAERLHCLEADAALPEELRLMGGRRKGQCQ